MMNKMKKENTISVIIPLFNKEMYIEECLNSIINQMDKDDEVIIINDGSTDRSAQIVKEYKKKCENIILKETKNNGAAAARNVALSIAKGSYVLFLDSDDYLSEKTFLYFKEIISKHHPEVIFGCSKKYLLNGIVETRILNINEGLYERDKLLDEISKVSKDPPVPQCYYIYRRELIENNNLRFFEGHIHEDELWTQEVMLNIKHIYYSKYVFYNYCVRNSSVMTSTNINKSGNDTLEICKKIKKIYDAKSKKDIPEILMNRFAEMLLMANYQLNDNKVLVEFAGRTMPIKYSFNKKTRIKSLIYMISPNIHRYIEKRRLK